MTADFKRKLPVVGAFQLKYIVDVDRYNILKTGQEKKYYLALKYTNYILN